MKFKALAMGLCLGFGAQAVQANPFSDVPRHHWAYGAIQRAVDAGVLEGYDGRFHGEKLINRYQMAVIIKRLLDAYGGMSSSQMSSSGIGSTELKNLESMMIEFADELALLNVKVSTLEDGFVELKADVDKLKRGGAGHMGHAPMGGGMGSAFTGFVSVALVNTDDGAAAGAGAAQTRYVAANADSTFFTLPQASMALDKEVGDGIGLHVQYDYATDAASGAGSVALNEAYLFVDEIFGDIGGKIGGFALPFQSWEINGPFRTLNDTISPSVKNGFLEGLRAVGLELTKTQDVSPGDVKWHLGIFSSDFTGAGAPGLGIGAGGLHSDAPGVLTGTPTLDDDFGFYIDVESGEDPDRKWGWRLGWFDVGGNANAVAPTTATNELDGWQAGFWFRTGDIKLQFEYLDQDWTSTGTPNTNVDQKTWYAMMNWQIGYDSSITLRFEDYETQAGAAAAVDGDTFTFAWNRRVSDTSMFQFEWLSPDVGNTDQDDDQVQFRYKVWF